MSTTIYARDTHETIQTRTTSARLSLSFSQILDGLAERKPGLPFPLQLHDLEYLLSAAVRVNNRSQMQYQSGSQKIKHYP